MATSEERRLAVYAALLAGYLPKYTRDSGRSDNSMLRQAVADALRVSEVVEEAFLALKGQELTGKEIDWSGAVQISTGLDPLEDRLTVVRRDYEKLVEDAEVVRSGHWNRLAAKRDKADARVKELEAQLETLCLPLSVPNTSDVRARLSRVIEDELVKIAGELAPHPHIEATRDGADEKRVNIDVMWPKGPVSEELMRETIQRDWEERTRGAAAQAQFQDRRTRGDFSQAQAESVQRLQGRTYRQGQAAAYPAEDRLRGMAVTQIFIDEVASFDEPIVEMSTCTLALKLLDAAEICPRCGYPAKQHRNWEAKS